jgi:hypothetical protein
VLTPTVACRSRLVPRPTSLTINSTRVTPSRRATPAIESARRSSGSNPAPHVTIPNCPGTAAISSAVSRMKRKHVGERSVRAAMRTVRSRRAIMPPPLCVTSAALATAWWPARLPVPRLPPSSSSCGRDVSPPLVKLLVAFVAWTSWGALWIGGSLFAFAEFASLVVPYLGAVKGFSVGLWRWADDPGRPRGHLGGLVEPRGNP